MREKIIITMVLIAAIIVILLICYIINIVKNFLEPEEFRTWERYEACDLNEEDKMEWKVIALLEAELKKRGFQWQDNYRKKAYVEEKHLGGGRQSNTYYLHYSHRTYGTEALICCNYNILEQSNKTLKLIKSVHYHGIELHTAFSDEKNIITTSELLPQMERERGALYMWCWEPDKVGEAIERHLKAVEQRLYESDFEYRNHRVDLETYMENRRSKHFIKGEEEGLYKYDEVNHCYRYTTKGALTYIVHGFKCVMDRKNQPLGAFKSQVQTLYYGPNQEKNETSFDR